MIHNLKCQQCGKKFTAKRRDAECCSSPCRKAKMEANLGAKALELEEAKKKTAPPSIQDDHPSTVRASSLSPISHNSGQVAFSLTPAVPDSPKVAGFLDLLSLCVRERVEVDETLAGLEEQKTKILNPRMGFAVGAVLGIGLGFIVLAFWHWFKPDRYETRYDPKFRQNISYLKKDQITPIMIILVGFWGLIGGFVGNLIFSDRGRKTIEYAELDAEINTFKAKRSKLLQAIDDYKEQVQLAKTEEINERIKEQEVIKKTALNSALDHLEESVPENFSPLGQSVWVEELQVQVKI